MVLINVQPTLQTLTGTTTTPAKLTAQVMSGGSPRVQVAVDTVTFPQRFAVVYDGTAWLAPPQLTALPAGCYWQTRLEAAGFALERSVILPTGAVDGTHFADLVDVDPTTSAPAPTQMSLLLAAMDSKIAAQAMPQLTLLAAATTAVAPTPGSTQPYNSMAGSLTPLLPALAALTAGATVLGVQRAIADTSSNTITITCSGTDTFDSGTQTLGLRAPGEIRVLQVVTLAGAKYWKVIDGNTPLSYFDNTYALKPVVVTQAQYDALTMKNTSTLYLISS